MTHPFFEKARRPRVLAHRGLITAEGEDSGVWDNTAASFAAAHALGVEIIETDCRLSADGDVILFHDPTLERLSGDERPVEEITTRELRAVFADHGGLLTIDEALQGFPGTRFNIDVKTDAAATPLGRAVASEAHRVLVTSFSDRRRQEALQAADAAGAALLPATSAGSRTIAEVLAASSLRLSPARILRGIDALQIPERRGALRVLTRALLRAVHRHGVEVHVWTVNDPEDMRRLRDLGVDGVVTDRADVAMQVLAPA